MARLIFVLGNPGTGKSTALRNLKKEDVSYITATGKELPFRSPIKPVIAKTMDDVAKMIVAAKKPIVVIDDVNYLFTKEVFGASEKTDKWDTYDKISKDFYRTSVNLLDLKRTRIFTSVTFIEVTNYYRLAILYFNNSAMPKYGGSNASISF